MRIPIVFSTDHNFVMPTGVAITSLIRSSLTEYYDIHILIAENVTPSDKLDLSAIVENTQSKIKFIDIGNIFDDAYEVRGISKATYFRLLIPWLFPEYDKIIYCDGDVIFRGGLKELYEIPLDNYYIGGVKDSFDAESFKKRLKGVNLEWGNYINAGILLINSKQQREDNLKQLYEKHIDKQYEYQDQDILNIVCKNRIKYLPFIYNFNPGKYPNFVREDYNLKERYPDFNSLNDISNIKIIHYCGEKPWNGKTGFFTNDWWTYYARTKWHNPLLEWDYYINTLFPPLNISSILGRIKNNITSSKLRTK